MGWRALVVAGGVMAAGTALGAERGVGVDGPVVDHPSGPFGVEEGLGQTALHEAPGARAVEAEAPRYRTSSERSVREQGTGFSGDGDADSAASDDRGDSSDESPSGVEPTQSDGT